MRTDTRIALIDSILKPLEKVLMKEDPTNVSKVRHSKMNWINYTVVKEYPHGLPWEATEDGKDRLPNRRLTLCFQVAEEDNERLESLLKNARERHTQRTCGEKWLSP